MSSAVGCTAGSYRGGSISGFEPRPYRCLESEAFLPPVVPPVVPETPPSRPPTFRSEAHFCLFKCAAYTSRRSAASSAISGTLEAMSLLGLFVFFSSSPRSFLSPFSSSSSLLSSMKSSCAFRREASSLASLRALFAASVLTVCSYNCRSAASLSSAYFLDSPSRCVCASAQLPLTKSLFNTRVVPSGKVSPEAMVHGVALEGDWMRLAPP
mmetsp:Transcript_10943/g.40479  ORF Transcript_10943/g.40479 Transcript_10943/m.40479 type:complete len:211 (+) Transcript_10943:4365-4997(+)